MNIPGLLRTGIVGEDASAVDDTTLTTVAGLLRAFSKEACVVAGHYTQGKGRRNVTGHDMKCALMYCARTYFSNDVKDLSDRLQTEIEAMREEDEEESGEEEDDESGEEEDDESGEEEDEESGEEEDEGEEVEEEECKRDPKDVQLARNVDCIVNVWDKWQPEDPVHQLLKRAIDNTPVP
jgi:histone H3/H4